MHENPIFFIFIRDLDNIQNILSSKPISKANKQSIYLFVIIG